MYSWHLKKQGCEDWRQNQVKSMSSTMWRGRLQKKEAERWEQRFSAWLDSWQCLSTFLCFSVLIFLWCLWIAFTIRKFQETFLCADNQSSHWDRFPTGSLIFWKLTRGLEGALELCARGNTRPSCLFQLLGLAGLGDSFMKPFSCSQPSPGPSGSPSLQALYLSLDPEPPYTAEHLQENEFRAWDSGVPHRSSATLEWVDKSKEPQLGDWSRRTGSSANFPCVGIEAGDTFSSSEVKL